MKTYKLYSYDIPEKTHESCNISDVKISSVGIRNRTGIDIHNPVYQLPYLTDISTLK